MNLGAKGTVHISITRSNGRIDHIGILSGGHWWQRLAGHLRLWLANARTKRGG
jgi:hypothetical protein